MAKLLGGAASLVLPGINQGDVPQWDTALQKYKPGALPPGTVPKAGDTLVFNTVINQFVPASQLPLPTGAAGGQFQIESFFADPDGTLESTWVDSSPSGLGNLVNTGGGTRPTLLTDVDGIRALRFDGVANFLRRTGMGAVNTSRHTVFLVAKHGFGGGTIPWSFGRAGVLSNGVGCCRGILGATSVVHGVEANNLGGAVAQSVGPATVDGVSNTNAGGFGVRRAWCFQWGGDGQITARWGGFMHVSGLTSFAALDGDPPVNNFSFTALYLGAENNGGGAPIGFSPVDFSYFSYYPGLQFNGAVVGQELTRLRAVYQCR